jgi:hypothetical protein
MSHRNGTSNFKSKASIKFKKLPEIDQSATKVSEASMLMAEHNNLPRADVPRPNEDLKKQKIVFRSHPETGICLLGERCLK